MLVRLWRFPLWWYKEVPARFLYILKNVTLVWEDLWAVRLMARFLFVPLFHDVTLWGRVLSFIYRLGRITFGLLTLVFVDALLIAGFAFWFIFPLYLLSLGLNGLILLLLFASAYLVLPQKDSGRKITDFNRRDFGAVARSELKNILEGQKTTLVLLTALLAEPFFEKTLIKIGLDPKALSWEIEKNKASLTEIQDPQRLIDLIWEKAKLFSSKKLNLNHLFLALLDLSKTFEEIVAKFDLDKKTTQEAVEWCEEKENGGGFLWDKDFNFHALSGVNRTLEGTVTPTLNTYIRDLTAEAKEGVLPEVVERKDLVEQVALILARSGENNVILVGEPGCGKTSLVYSLAQKIIDGSSPPPLRFKRVVELDYTAVLGGAETEGEILERMKKIIEEIEYSGNVILFLDEIQNLITGDEQRNAVYSSLEPHLSSVKFQVIASITPENYHATLEQNEGFANLFQKVEIPETSEEETLAILKKAASRFEKRQKVVITFPALLASIAFSKRYLHDRVLPEKAVGILDEASVAVATHSPSGIVGKEDIAKVIALKSHVPITKVTTEEKEKLLNLEKVLHQRMVDQEEAVSAVADALRRARAGIREEKKPIASFLFVGPTGVGKTELARTLAEFYFGSQDSMIRLDMSEFQTKESIYSLIGPPIGQKGVELGGRLTEAIRRRPFALLLLDETEKAHQDILNLFLQVMDEARLTDSSGRTVDFSSAILIATSNAGTGLIQEEIEKKTEIEEIKKKVSEFLKTIFRPEFLNRFDGIIVFKPLTSEEIESVAKLMIKKLADNLNQKGIKIETTPQFLTKLAKEGYDPALGARPLRRLIQDKVEAKIAEKILGEELKRGATLTLDENFLT